MRATWPSPTGTSGSTGVPARAPESSVISASQGSAATAAVTAHSISPSRQPPPSARPIGTVSTDELVRPTARAVEYAVVITPIRVGKCRLTSEGSTTLAVAMPARASRERPRNTTTESTRVRAASPTTTASSAASVSRCGPTARASRAAMLPKTANATTGSEVSTPASAPDMSRSRRRSPSTGPMLTAAGRRLKARTTMPTSTSTRRVEGFIGTCASRRRRPRHAG